jgi:hypothetical protein
MHLIPKSSGTDTAVKSAQSCAGAKPMGANSWMRSSPSFARNEDTMPLNACSPTPSHSGGPATVGHPATGDDLRVLSEHCEAPAPSREPQIFCAHDMTPDSDPDDDDERGDKIGAHTYLADMHAPGVVELGGWGFLAAMVACIAIGGGLVLGLQRAGVL